MPVITALDGGYDQPGGLEVSTPEYDYPFESNGDMESVIITRTYKQAPRAFFEDRLSGAFRPGTLTDRRVKNAYLMATSKPLETPTGLYVFKRIFATVPTTQTVPDSTFVTKPNIPGEFPQVLGTSLITQPDPTVTRWVFYTQKAVTSDSGVPTGNVPTGGTYTLTAGASTTAPLPYNATAADVQTALNALASISDRGSVSVTGSYTSGFTITFQPYAAGSIDASALTGTGGYTAPATSVTTLNVVEQSFRINALPGSASFMGGTFTCTVFGQTTAAIAYNASISTVLAAFTALSKVGATGVTVLNPGAGNGYPGTSILQSGSAQIGFYLKVEPPALSVNAAGLTPTGSSATITSLPAYSATLAFTGVNVGERVLYSAAHGIEAAGHLVVTINGTTYEVSSGGFSVTSNTVVLTASSGAAFFAAGSATFVGKQNGNEYTAGTKLTRISRVTDYYLPGITPGIETANDIPLPSYEGDAGSLLAAILTGAESINYEVGELSKWNGWPILVRTITTLNASLL